MRVVLLVALSSIACTYPNYVYVDDDASFASPDGGDETTSEASTDDGFAPFDGCASPNGCGGCNDKGVAGARCEPTPGGCGQWTCDGTLVKCVAADPPPGTKCGMCMTSKTSCTTIGTTVCAMLDDRTIYDDLRYETKDVKVYAVDRTNELIIAYATGRTISDFDASLYLERLPYACAHVAALPHPDPACTDCKAASSGGFDCTVPTPSGGKLTLTFYEGVAPTSLVPIGTGSVAATTLATTGFQSITFDKEITTHTPGAPVAIGITTDSSAYAFQVYGGAATGFPAPPAKMTSWHRTKLPMGAWAQDATNIPALVVRGKACAP